MNSAKEIMEKVVALGGKIVSGAGDGMHYDIFIHEDGMSLLSNDINRTFSLFAKWEDVNVILSNSLIIISGEDQDGNDDTWQMKIVIPISHLNLA